MIERPKSLGGKGWLEMLVGMIHPNVLKISIDQKYHYLLGAVALTD